MTTKKKKTTARKFVGKIDFIVSDGINVYEVGKDYLLETNFLPLEDSVFTDGTYEIEVKGGQIIFCKQK